MSPEEIRAEAERLIMMSKPEIVQCWRLLPTDLVTDTPPPRYAERLLGGYRRKSGRQRRREYKLNWTRRENFTLCFWEPNEFSDGISACLQSKFGDSVSGVTLRGIIRKQDLGPLPLCLQCAELFPTFIMQDAMRMLQRESLVDAPSPRYLKWVK